GDPLSVLAVARRAALHEHRLAARDVELLDWHQRGRRDRVLAPPGRRLAHLAALGQPGEIGRDRQHFFRRGRRRLDAFAAAGGVLAAQEAVDDPILEADETAGPAVVLRELTGDADERQRLL